MKNQRAVLVLACVVEFMVVLDVSVVNVALPSIKSGLDVRPIELQWVVDGYALTFAGFLLIGGRLADLQGRRRMLMVGLLAFSVPSLIGGLSSGPALLIAARVAQGIGGAILAPLTLSMITTTFPEGPIRARAIAAWTAVALAGGAAGNLVGGVITEYLDWRWVLLVNVPVAALAMGAGWMVLPNTRPVGPMRLDVTGALLASTGTLAVTLGLTRAGEHGWHDPILAASMAIGGLALVAFVHVERRHEHALLPLSMLRRRTISLGNLTMLLAGASFVPMWYFLSLGMQNVLGYGPLTTGLGFLPHAVVTVAVGLRIAPRLMEWVPAAPLVAAGALIAAIGFIWQSRFSPTSDYWSGILGPGLLMSIGGGLLNTPLTHLVTSGVDDRDAGAASGLMNTAKRLGGILGIASLVTIAGEPGTEVLPLDSYRRVFVVVAAVLTIVAALTVTLRHGEPDVGGDAGAVDQSSSRLGRST